jgi:hypothetical protein
MVEGFWEMADIIFILSSLHPSFCSPTPFSTTLFAVLFLDP